MNTLTKKFVSTTFIMSCLMLNFTTSTMEKPTDYPLQLQKQTKKEETIIVNCRAMIPATWQEESSIKYAMEPFHNSMYKDNRLSSTIKDPVIGLVLTDVSNNQSIFFHVPLKYCYNLNNGSTLQIFHRHYYPWLDETTDSTPKPLLIHAVCQENPNLPGNTFAKQMDNDRNKFYKNPGIFVLKFRPGHCKSTEFEMLSCAKEFIITDIVHQTDSRLWPITMKHGENGCSSDEKLEKAIIDTQIPTNKSVFKSLKNRELTGSFK